MFLSLHFQPPRSYPKSFGDLSRDLQLDFQVGLLGAKITIIDCTGDAPRILRSGAITSKLIAIAKMEAPSRVVRLAVPKSYDEFAQVLDTALRRADADCLFEVVVNQPIGIGMAVAIRDCLTVLLTGVST